MRQFAPGNRQTILVYRVQSRLVVRALSVAGFDHTGRLSISSPLLGDRSGSQPERLKDFLTREPRVNLYRLVTPSWTAHC